MQNLIVVSVRDKLSDIYSQPMYFPTQGMAVRAFQDALKDPQNNIQKHPDDYDLYQLGEWDDTTGAFKNETPPKLIAQGSQHKPA